MNVLPILLLSEHGVELEGETHCSASWDCNLMAFTTAGNCSDGSHSFFLQDKHEAIFAGPFLSVPEGSAQTEAVHVQQGT